MEQFEKIGNEIVYLLDEGRKNNITTGCYHTESRSITIAYFSDLCPLPKERQAGVGASYPIAWFVRFVLKPIFAKNIGPCIKRAWKVWYKSKRSATKELFCYFTLKRETGQHWLCLLILSKFPSYHGVDREHRICCSLEVIDEYASEEEVVVAGICDLLNHNFELICQMNCVEAKPLTPLMRTILSLQYQGYSLREISKLKKLGRTKVQGVTQNMLYQFGLSRLIDFAHICHSLSIF